MPTKPATRTRYHFPMHFDEGRVKVTVYEIDNREDYQVYTVACSIAGQGRTRKTFAEPAVAINHAKSELRRLVKAGAHLLVEVPASKWTDYQEQTRRLHGTPLATAVDFYLRHRADRARKDGDSK